MNKVKLIFGTYNTQSPGNYNYIFEQAYQKAYKPFLTVLYNFPNMVVTLQYSGILLQWLEEFHPEFIMLLNEMVKRKQVELLTGGFYDPVFTLIPPADRIGQIEKLTTHLRKKFGKRPRGCWITELSWEPCFTSMFNTCGINYIFLDERSFIEAGLVNDDLRRPCITEDQGKTLTVFPLSTSISKQIPEQEPDEVVEQLLAYTRKDPHERGGRYKKSSHKGRGRESTKRDGEGHGTDESRVEEEIIITCISAGEYFGYTGNTYDRCYGERWFERFFTLIQQNREHIQVTTPWRCSKTARPMRRGYFPTTMNRHDVRRLNGGITEEKPSPQTGLFKNFLCKYQESNLLYAKMIYTGILVNQIRGDKSRKKAAREELWRGQNNSFFWHGNTPGIYYNHLRKTAYNALIEAEKITHEKGMFIPSIIKTDFDFDGVLEYLYQGDELNAYVHVTGGILFELDYLPVSWNYLDTMKRYKEPYHNRGEKDNRYDSCLRKAFLDRFFRNEETLEDFQNCRLSDEGLLIFSDYNVDNVNRDHNELVLSVSRSLDGNEGTTLITANKHYIFKKNSIDVYYKLSGDSARGLPPLFGTEINLSLASAGRESQRIFAKGHEERREIGNEAQVTKEVTECEIQDLYNDVVMTISATNPFELWSLPVTTTVLNGDEWEEIYQSTCLLPRWNYSLGNGNMWETRISIRFDQM